MVRFDKPCVLVNGAVEYFREHMAVGDYLTQEGKVEMTWRGVGAERLGQLAVRYLRDLRATAFIDKRI